MSKLELFVLRQHRGELMTTTNAEELLRSFIIAEFGHKLESPDFSADLDLLGEGVIDSMGVMQITTFLEGNWA